MFPIMNKIYNIFLDNKKIGSTQLEKGDALLGITYGVLNFINSNMGYDFIKNYCEKRHFYLSIDYPESKLISTKTIDTLKIVNNNGIEIKWGENQITGMDGDEYYIAIEEIPFPFFEEEFPHYVKAYEDSFKNREYSVLDICHERSDKIVSQTNN